MLVDAITEHEPGRRLVAVKNVTVNEEFFQGHFPGAPTLPGVLMLESLSQVAAILLLQREGAPPDTRDLSARRERREVPPAGRARRPAAARDLARPPARVARARAGDARTSAIRSSPKPSCCSASCPTAPKSIRRPSCIPSAQVGAGTEDRSARGDRRERPPRRELRGRRVGGDRRLDRHRRRHGDFSLRLDRPDPAGPQVQGRGDAAGHRAAATSSASS